MGALALQSASLRIGPGRGPSRGHHPSQPPRFGRAVPCFRLLDAAGLWSHGTPFKVEVNPEALRSPAEPCGALRSPAEPCGALRSPAEPCGALRSPAQPCGALRSPAEPCGALRSPAEPLRSPAASCSRVAPSNGVTCKVTGPEEQNRRSRSWTVVT